MPPALSDEEGPSSGDEIPYRSKDKDASEEPEDEGDDGEEEAEEEEFVVEHILSHNPQGAEVLYEVKWQGYEAKKDRTWEPESNLAGAKEVLREYWESIGGKPEPTGGKKRKGKKSAADSKTATPVETKRAKKEKEWSPPPGSWENDVDYVDTVEESIDPKTAKKARFAYLVWNNSKKTQHPLKHVYHKCPQKMLLYYESHLVFTNNQGHEDRINGADKEVIMRGISDD
ncbi:hypothetical protein BDV96DRAFT_572083 [Lophiotrema nucula]|uniref:Chromo domain-containing protein n=1 Tax=Lophiotrema nucula TaxID=690887 RepID=A0A6A5ZDZ8_9PLEO|nr:hypothetical protein BDV96DRAFT_572083 [Lophiotrema nucula]